MMMRADVYDGTFLDQTKTYVFFLKWVNIRQVFVGWLSFLCIEDDMFQLILLLLLLFLW